MSAPISFERLTRRYGDVTAVEDVTFAVAPGRVAGLVGRNGAGKSTCLRALLGLLTPTAGHAHVLGGPYAALPGAPLRVGAMMEGLGANGAMRAERHLQIAAARLGLPASRVAEVARDVDLDPAAMRRRVKTFSTGMRQRLDLAAALLADPEVLVLDEPTNGLDPDGVRWVRALVRRLAAEGRTVLIASHHLAELEQSIDDVVVLDRTVRFAGTLAELVGTSGATLEDRYVELVHSATAPSREEVPA